MRSSFGFAFSNPAPKRSGLITEPAALGVVETPASECRAARVVLELMYSVRPLEKGGADNHVCILSHE